MPRSKTFLPDVNVWVALASRRHVFHQVAAAWMDRVEGDRVALCRITQMGMLRLLTNTHVMSEDVLSQAQAWKLYFHLCQDARISFLAEPPGLEEAWHKLSTRTTSQSHWTDAYLQAFAFLSDTVMVTFDRGFRQFGDPRTVILTSESV